MLNFEFHTHHAALLDAFNLKHQTVMLNHFSGLEHVSGFGHQKPADRCVSFRLRNGELQSPVEIAHCQSACQLKSFLINLRDLLIHFLIVLVRNFTDDLFEQVFERDDPFESAMFIDHESKMHRVEALQYWVDLSAKHKVMPGGVIEWGTTPKDFLEQKAAMIWTTTGNLANIRSNASFPFGVAMLPAKKQPGSPTGGGNFYVFAKTTPAEQQASLKFIKWATAPQRAAQWSIATGYVAVTPAAWETPEMKKYVQEVPQAVVARDPLQHSVAELSTHDNQRVTKALNDGLQAALTGTKTPAQAMQDAQREADRLLRSYK